MTSETDLSTADLAQPGGTRPQDRADDEQRRTGRPDEAGPGSGERNYETSGNRVAEGRSDDDTVVIPPVTPGGGSTRNDALQADQPYPGSVDAPGTERGMTGHGDRDMDAPDMGDRSMSDRDMSDRDMSDRDMSDRDMSDRDMGDGGMSDRGMGDRSMGDRDMGGMTRQDMDDRGMSDRGMGDRGTADRDAGDRGMGGMADRDMGDRGMSGTADRDMGDRGMGGMADRDMGDRGMGGTVDRDAGDRGTGGMGDGDATGRGTGGAGHDVALLDQADTEAFRRRWSDTQARFVDDPREAVQTADGLVAELMQTLAQSFSQHKGELEAHWTSGGDPDTEDLRQALQRYRSFFDRLLSA